MKPTNGQAFGEYVETLRKSRNKSLRKTAAAIDVSPQFYSEVEKGRRSAFTVERLELLKIFLALNEEETNLMYNKAAEARKNTEFDFSDYIIQRDYAMAALRTAKELNADEADWQRFVDELRTRKEQ